MSLEAVTMTDWVRRSGTTDNREFAFHPRRFPNCRKTAAASKRRQEPETHGAGVLIRGRGGGKHRGQLIGDFPRIGMVQVKDAQHRDVLAWLVQIGDDVGDHAHVVRRRAGDDGIHLVVGNKDRVGGHIVLSRLRRRRRHLRRRRSPTWEPPKPPPRRRRHRHAAKLLRVLARVMSESALWKISFNSVATDLESA